MQAARDAYDQASGLKAYNRPAKERDLNRDIAFSAQDTAISLDRAKADLARTRAMPSATVEPAPAPLTAADYDPTWQGVHETMAKLYPTAPVGDAAIMPPNVDLTNLPATPVTPPAATPSWLQPPEQQQTADNAAVARAQSWFPGGAPTPTPAPITDPNRILNLGSIVPGTPPTASGPTPEEAAILARWKQEESTKSGPWAEAASEQFPQTSATAPQLGTIDPNDIVERMARQRAQGEAASRYLADPNNAPPPAALPGQGGTQTPTTSELTDAQIMALPPNQRDIAFRIRQDNRLAKLQGPVVRLAVSDEQAKAMNTIPLVQDVTSRLLGSVNSGNLSPNRLHENGQTAFDMSETLAKTLDSLDPAQRQQLWTAANTPGTDLFAVTKSLRDTMNSSIGKEATIPVRFRSPGRMLTETEYPSSYYTGALQQLLDYLTGTGKAQVRYATLPTR
jgi:hypothetical protein